MRSLAACSILMAGVWTLGALLAAFHLPSCAVACLLVALPWWLLAAAAGRGGIHLR